MVRPLSLKAIRRGAFAGVEQLKARIEEILAAWNKEPKPFVWTAAIESILERLSRCRRGLERIQPGRGSPRFRKRKKFTCIYFADTTLAARGKCGRFQAA